VERALSLSSLRIAEPRVKYDGDRDGDDDDDDDGDDGDDGDDYDR